MKKVIYVEGEAELVFVYQLIITHYQYQGTLFYLQTVNLNQRSGVQLASHYGNVNAPDYFQLVCVGGDTRVVSKLSEDYDRLINEDFDVIVGLRDIYSEAYTSIAGHNMDLGVVHQLIEGQRGVLKPFPKVSLCFSIMEVEAWIIGMYPFLKRKYPGIGLGHICDPQKECVHPFNELKCALNRMGVSFNKHWRDFISIMDQITREDFEELYSSPCCLSFNEFYDKVFS